MSNAKPKKTIKHTEQVTPVKQVQQPAINNQTGFDPNMQQATPTYPTGYQPTQNYQPSQPSQNTKPTNPTQPSGNNSDDDLNNFMMQ